MSSSSTKDLSEVSRSSNSSKRHSRLGQEHAEHCMVLNRELRVTVAGGPPTQQVQDGSKAEPQLVRSLLSRMAADM